MDEFTSNTFRRRLAAAMTRETFTFFSRANALKYLIACLMFIATLVH